MLQSLSSMGAGKKPGPQTKTKDRTNLMLRYVELRARQGLSPLFVGRDVVTAEEVLVTMATPQEAAAFKARADETFDAAAARLQGVYAGSGEKRRPQLRDLKEAGNKLFTEVGGLVSFSDAIRGEDGIYRAHWMECFSNKPGSEVVTGVLAVRPKFSKPATNSAEPRKSFRAEIFFPEKAAVLNTSNAVAELQAALVPTTAEGKLRRPIVAMRLLDEKGAVLAMTNISARYEAKDVTDEFAENPEEKTVYMPLDADTSITHLFDPENTAQNAALARAMLYGVVNGGEQEQYPSFKEGQLTADQLADVHATVDAVRAGKVKVEIIPGVSLPAGDSTNTNLIKKSLNERDPVNYFRKTIKNPGEEKGHPEFCFTPASVLVAYGKDGLPFFIKWQTASPTASYVPLSKLATVNDNPAAPEAAARLEAAAEPDTLGAMDHDEAVAEAAVRADKQLGNEP